MALTAQQEIELYQSIIVSLGHVPQSDNTVALLTQWLLILISQVP